MHSISHLEAMRIRLLQAIKCFEEKLFHFYGIHMTQILNEYVILIFQYVHTYTKIGNYLVELMWILRI